MAIRKVKIGLAGFGTVGSGVAKILLEDGDRIAEMMGVKLELACVVDKDTTTKREVELPEGILTDDIEKLLGDESIDIGVELIGGTGAAKDIQSRMLSSGMDVVTANKALLACCGPELYQRAVENNKCIAYEASCAGGIPIITAMRTGLAANKIEAIYGILNGTCNYILSSMTATGASFDSALAAAQQKGFAEADPTLDINGGDSAHKLAILGSIAFGYQLDIDDVYYEGIEHISDDDIRYGLQMGYVLKLLAIGESLDGRISLRVHPSFIPENSALAGVEGSFNAVSLQGSAVGQVMLYGRGAGMMPTASAVVADIIDVAIGNSKRSFDHLRFKPKPADKTIIAPMGDIESRFYIRLRVKDKPGVFAQIAEVLSELEISISGILQQEDDLVDDAIPVIMTTHANKESKISEVTEALNKLESVCSRPACIRIIDLPEDRD